ncbi:MAG TPA: thioesterase family protein [Bacillales bacterium]|nr:thioesterase family protein [Bacillales bacterium]
MISLLEVQVSPEWVDYNGHMNDAAYARVFSMAVDELMERLGLDKAFRNKHGYTLFTLETHLCYLQETHEGMPLQIDSQLLDHDAKRLHVLFVMKDEAGNRLATSEQMLMGMDAYTGRPGLFPALISQEVLKMAKADQDCPVPKEVGRRIGIRKH